MLRWMRISFGSGLFVALVAQVACGGRADEADELGTDVVDGTPVVIAARPPLGTTPGTAEPPPTQEAPAAVNEVPVEEPERPRGPSPGLSMPTRPPLGPDDVFRRLCGDCHGEEAIRAGNVQGGFDYIDNVDRLVEEGWIIALRSDDSPIIQMMEAGEMPPPGVEPRPTRGELAYLRSFIDQPAFWPEP